MKAKKPHCTLFVKNPCPAPTLPNVSFVFEYLGFPPVVTGDKRHRRTEAQDKSSKKLRTAIQQVGKSLPILPFRWNHCFSCANMLSVWDTCQALQDPAHHPGSVLPWPLRLLILLSPQPAEMGSVLCPSAYRGGGRQSGLTHRPNSKQTAEG